MESNIFFKKNALVIGGTSGAGLETARLLCENGAYVTATGRTIPEFSAEKKIKFVKCEFDNDNFYSVFQNELFPLLQNTDFLVYAAGPFVQKSLEQTQADDWVSMANLNFALPGMCLSSALKFMKKRNFGRIVIFGGTRTDSVRAYKTNAAYAGAKTALSVLVKSAATEAAPFGITCNAILPGFIHNAPQNTKNVTETQLAQNAIYLMQNEFLNGVLLNVDRGWNP